MLSTGTIKMKTWTTAGGFCAGGAELQARGV